VLFLCSEKASFITGATLPIDGGFVLYNAGSS
jgi:NAD(P)-dependent dehydrogenase (short-subunit alcohol dehydrogenase family)